MKISELYEIICPDEFKDIKLDIRSISNIESLNGSYPMSFPLLNANERELFEMSQNKESYAGSTESIIIYDVVVEAFYNCLIITTSFLHMI